jgi:hypothetical protein
MMFAARERYRMEGNVGGLIGPEDPVRDGNPQTPAHQAQIQVRHYTAEAIRWSSAEEKSGG